MGMQADYVLTGCPGALRWASVTVAAECRERRPVIEQVGKELLEVNKEGLEQVEGHRVVELLATTPRMPLEESASADLNGSAPSSAPAVYVRSTAMHPTSCSCSALRLAQRGSSPWLCVWSAALILCSRRLLGTRSQQACCGGAC